MTPDVSVLEVRLYGETIGTLTHLPGDQSIFAFTDEYVAQAARPTLSLGFKDEFGELLTEIRPTRRRLTPFFSNLLPEGPLRRYLAKRADVHVDREFFLLWVLGRDLPGAVTVVPADGEAWPAAAHDAPDETKSRQARAMRFSLAGVQLKFSAITDTGKKGGLVIPTQGVGGEWIVKLPSTQFDGVPENEYSMMTLARAVGIDVPDVQLLDVADIAGLPEGVGDLRGQAYAVRRFDRTDGGSVHMEDFAQVFDMYPEDKYERATMRRVARVLSIEAGEDSVDEFIRRMTFSVLVGNGDMHLKNWSLIYPDRRTARLSPAYDFVSTIPYIRDDEFALKFSRTRRFDGYTTDELIYLARKAELPVRPVLKTARETVDRFLDVWSARKSDLPLTRTVVEIIDRHLGTLPIIRGDT